MQTWHPSGGCDRDLSWAIHGRNMPLGGPDGAGSHSARPPSSSATRAPPSGGARDAGDTAPHDRGRRGVLCAQQRARHSRSGAPPRTRRGHPAGVGATTTEPGAIADVETGVSRVGGTGRAADGSAAPAPPAAPCRPARRDLSSGSGRKNSFVSLHPRSCQSRTC